VAEALAPAWPALALAWPALAPAWLTPLQNNASVLYLDAAGGVWALETHSAFEKIG